MFSFYNYSSKHSLIKFTERLHLKLWFFVMVLINNSFYSDPLMNGMDMRTLKKILICVNTIDINLLFHIS